MKIKFSCKHVVSNYNLNKMGDQSSQMGHKECIRAILACACICTHNAKHLFFSFCRSYRLPGVDFVLDITTGRK